MQHRREMTPDFFAPSPRLPRLCFLGYRHLREFSGPVIEQYRDRAEIELVDGTVSQTVALARERVEQGAVDAFISAGANAGLLRRQVRAPVATIQLGGLDILQALITARRSSRRVGVVVYAHVNPDFNGDGVTNSADINFRGGISRWGGYLGTVGAYRRVSGGCWDVRTTGGQHVHMELSNERRYACYRPGMGDHAQLRTSNYLGYLGGNFASGRKAACPNGI